MYLVMSCTALLMHTLQLFKIKEEIVNKVTETKNPHLKDSIHFTTNQPSLHPTESIEA